MLKSLLILAILPIFFISAYAEPFTIETANNDLFIPGCAETEIGCYTPNILTVQTGDVIAMINVDENAMHTFTSGTVDGFAPTADGTFNSGILFFGNSFEWTPDTVGEYPYYCMLHVWMQGSIIVEGEEIIELEPTEELPFDLVLDQLAMRVLDKNIMRLANDIDRANLNLEKMEDRLEGATERNEPVKIQIYSERISSLKAFVEICTTLVDTIHTQIQLYS